MTILLTVLVLLIVSLMVIGGLRWQLGRNKSVGQIRPDEARRRSQDNLEDLVRFAQEQKRRSHTK